VERGVKMPPLEIVNKKEAFAMLKAKISS
jgi:hypothetical protein